VKKIGFILFVLLVSGIFYLGNISNQDSTNMAGKQMSGPLNPNTILGPSNPINAPNLFGAPPNSSSQFLHTAPPPYTGGSKGAAGPTIDHALVGQYDQSIGNTQSAINRLGDQFNSGASGIDASYQNALNQLLGAKNQANQAYDQNVLQTKQDYVGGKNTIRSKAGSSLSGLLRLLGSRGAGGGSAATLTAPGAVARQATLQQTDLGNTFGHNIQGLDQNWGQYLQGYNNQVNSAGSQRDQQKGELQRQIDTNRASLLQTLAQLSGQRAQAAGGSATGAAQPYLDQANSVLDRSSRYTTAPISYQTQAYNAPALDKYIVNPGATPTFNGQPQTNDYTSPYLAALLGKKQQQLAAT
jgi:hypothetical protein